MPYNGNYRYDLVCFVDRVNFIIVARYNRERKARAVGGHFRCNIAAVVSKERDTNIQGRFVNLPEDISLEIPFPSRATN